MEEKREVAKKLIRLGISIDMVIEGTGLTRQEIEVIKTSIEH